MKRKGFATSAILYTLLLLFLALMVGILNNLQNKKVILDTLTKETKEQLEGSNQKEEEVIKVYGIRRAFNTNATTWERIEDSKDLVATAIKNQSDLDNGVRNDFDDIYPWSEIKSYNYNTDTKEITAKIGDNSFSFTGNNGEVLTYIPKFYYKRYQDNDYEYIYISKDQVDEDYKKSEAFSIGRYTMSGNSSGVHSISGKTPLSSITIAQARNYAKALGDNFSQLDYHYFIIQLLYLVEYADYNSQDKLGQGYINGGTTSISSGGCDTLEMKSGTLNNDGKHSMIYRGIEDIYGNIWQYVDGINIKNYQPYICYEPSNYISDKFDGCYQPIGYTIPSVNDWASKLGYNENYPLIGFPVAVGGSANTYIGDFYHQNGIDSQTPIVGGAMYSSNGQAGLWFWNSTKSSYTNIDFSARLIKYK